MYNRTPRMGRPPKPATPSNVAPNTYTICTGYQYKKNRAPFLSCSSRKASFVTKPYTEAIYCIQGERRIVGGASINYTAERKTIAVNCDPGPGDYSPIEHGRKCKRTPREVKGKGKVYFCRVPFKTNISAPSVPTRIDENGYSMVNCRLTKVPPACHDTSLGPAFYRVPRGEIFFTTRKYKGCCWSCSGTQRGTKLGNGNPGPGAYSPEKGVLCRKDLAEEDFRGLARYFAFIPRFTESEQLKACKEDLPGPSDYDIVKPWYQEDPRAKSISPRPFISGAERLKQSNVLAEFPSPAHYNVSDKFMKQKTFSVTCAPFSQRASRFPTKHETSSPAPGTYEVKGFLEEKLQCSINKCSLVEIPFGKKAARELSAIPEDAFCNPGPGHYELGSEHETGECDGSVFKSTAPRFKQKCPEPGGPATYNISEVYNKFRNPVSFHQGEVAFNSRVPRFKDAAEDIPAVGEYETDRRKEPKGYISGVPRKTVIGDDNPGPGYYTIDTIDTAAIRAPFFTHNIRLKEQILKKRLRKPPCETRIKWCKLLKKDKVLRWFTKTGPDYKHC